METNNHPSLNKSVLYNTLAGPSNTIGGLVFSSESRGENACEYVRMVYMKSMPKQYESSDYIGGLTDATRGEVKHHRNVRRIRVLLVGWMISKCLLVCYDG